MILVNHLPLVILVEFVFNKRLCWYVIKNMWNSKYSLYTWRCQNDIIYNKLINCIYFNSACKIYCSLNRIVCDSLWLLVHIIVKKSWHCRIIRTLLIIKLSFHRTQGLQPSYRTVFHVVKKNKDGRESVKLVYDPEPENSL